MVCPFSPPIFGFRQLNSGDGSALNELIRIYYPEILRYGLWHTFDRQTAEDATQETFLKAVRHLDNYIHHGKFRAFLFKIAVNICTDLWRHSKIQAPYEREAQADKTGLYKCQKILLAIGNETRQAIIMVLMETTCKTGLRVGEITEQVHLSRPAVSHHLKILRDAGIILMREEGAKNF